MPTVTEPRSLVIAPQWLGDAVMCEPLLRALAARGERLTVAALPALAPLFLAMPQVHAVRELPFARGGLQWSARRALGHAWRGQFERAYVLPNSLKSALLPFFARIPTRVGYVGEARYGLLNQRLPKPRGKDAMVAFYSALSALAAPPVAANNAPTPTLAPTPTPNDNPRLQLAPEQIAAVLAKFGLGTTSGTTPYYVLAPGSEYGPAKRWPVSHYAQLAVQLLGQMPAPVVILGSAKERDLAQHISTAAGPRCHNLAGQTSLSEALALVAGAHAVVSNDSGLMHVAAAFGRPQVALFGSSSPLHTPPLNPLAHVLWLKTEPDYQPPLDCAPCFARQCRFGHTRCLNDIAPARVVPLLPPLLPTV